MTSLSGDPCQPSPCGPYSNCRVIDNHAVCSCQPDYVGSPPQCRPECVVSTDCTQNMACIDQKCRDPCPGTCGQNADCQVINHNPVCSCMSGYTGDPFFGCVKEGKIFIILFLIYYFNLLYVSICLRHLYFYFYFLSDIYIYFSTIIFLVFTILECLNNFYSGTQTAWTRTKRKSMHSITLWTKFSMSCDWWIPSVFLFAELCRQSSKLSTRVCHQRRMSWKSCMSERTVRRSLSWLVWCEHFL